MGFESWEPPEEESIEEISILEQLRLHPEWIFDCPIEEAKKEAERVASDLSFKQWREHQLEDERKRAQVKIIRNFESGPEKSGKQTIQIVWSRDDGKTTMLNLTQLKEGRGGEGTILGHVGEHGEAIVNDKGKYVFAEGKSTPLAKLFGIPEVFTVVVVPTEVKWAVERGNPLFTSMLGDNCVVIYIGLGTLLMGEEWMLAGFHEGGHLPQDGNLEKPSNDENAAWSVANRRYAQIHEGQKEGIVRGKIKGLFHLLHRPTDSSDITIGKLMQWGLTSHWSASQSANIPQHWKRKSNEIIDDLLSHMAKAHEAYEECFGE